MLQASFKQFQIRQTSHRQEAAHSSVLNPSNYVQNFRMAGSAAIASGDQSAPVEHPGPQSQRNTWLWVHSCSAKACTAVL